MFVLILNKKISTLEIIKNVPDDICECYKDLYDFLESQNYDMRSISFISVDEVEEPTIIMNEYNSRLRKVLVSSSVSADSMYANDSSIYK